MKCWHHLKRCVLFWNLNQFKVGFFCFFNNKIKTNLYKHIPNPTQPKTHPKIPRSATYWSILWYPISGIPIMKSRGWAFPAAKFLMNTETKQCVLKKTFFLVFKKKKKKTFFLVIRGLEYHPFPRKPFKD